MREYLEGLNMEKYSKWSSFLFCGLYIFWIIWLLVNNAMLISFPYPIEFKEGHTISSTCLMLRGILPYSLDTYPEYYNSYGIMYNLLNLPFAYIFGNSLVLHRIVNEICILSAICMALFYKRKPSNRTILTAAIGCFYALYHITANIPARPDGLGVLLFISTIVIALRNDFSNKSLSAAGILTILAFLTKPYYILGWYLISSVLLFKDWKRFLIANTIYHVVYIVVCIIINAIFPLYFYETIFAYRSSVGGDISYSLNQMGVSIKRLSPFIFIIGIGSFELWRRERRVLWPYLLMIFFISIILIYPLGTNNGAYLLYHVQLLAPILLAMTADILNEKIFSHIIVQLVVFMSCLYIYMKLPTMKRPQKDGWLTMEHYIKESNNICNNESVAPLLMLQNKSIVDDGVSDFVCEFEPKPLTTSLFGKDSLLLERKNEYIQTINSNLEEKKYDCVIIGQFQVEAIDNQQYSNYMCVDTVHVDFPCNFPYTLYVYKPIKD